MTIRRRAAVAAAVATTLALIAGTAGAAERATTATIASSTVPGFRAVVTAIKGSEGAAPSATVNVAAFANVDGRWTLLGRLRVGRPEGFFWKVVTGVHAIRGFSIGTDSQDRVTLQLLVTPALGWSPIYRYHVESGSLVAG